MPDNKPSYMDLLKSSAESFIDPNVIIPTLGAAAVVGGQQAVKRIPGVAAKVAPKVTATANKVANAASNAYRTGIPLIDNAITSAKVNYSNTVPRILNKVVEPITEPIRQFGLKAAKTPFGQTVGKATRLAGTAKGMVGSAGKLLTTGVGGLVNKAGAGVLMGSPGGDPYNEDEAAARDRINQGIFRNYSRLSQPDYLSKLAMTDEGRKQAAQELSVFASQLKNAGLPDKVVQHIGRAMKDPANTDLSDLDSIKDILTRFIPKSSTVNDPTFRKNDAYTQAYGGGGVPLSDVVNAVTLNIPDIAANAIPYFGALASGGKVDLNNPLFDAMKNSNSKGEDATNRFFENQRVRPFAESIQHLPPQVQQRLLAERMKTWKSLGYF